VPFVAGLAHLGGFVGGFLACALVAPVAFQRTTAPGWLRAANVAVGVVTLVAVGAAAREVSGAGDVLARRGERLLRMEEVAPEMLNNTAWMLATNGTPTPDQLDVAVRLAQRAVRETGRTAPNVLDTLAEAQFQAGRTDDALETIDEAIALAPAEPYFVEQRRRFTGERAPDDRPAPPADARPAPLPDDEGIDPGPQDPLDEDDEDNPAVSV
jgi:hypothetical protein